MLIAYRLVVALVAVLGVGEASFQVATIKPAVPDAFGSSGEDGRRGFLRVYNVSLKRCIRYAYGMPETQILGGPKWVDDLRYDITAKADEPVGELELLRMLQPLLADRFKLKLHRERRMIAGYALIVGKAGVTAKVSEAKGSGGNGGPGRIDAVGTQIAALTIRLSELLERPVIDQTHDTRKFDFHLRWTPDTAAPGIESSGSDGPSLFRALEEQLGLRLESKTVPADVLVIDHAELPSEN